MCQTRLVITTLQPTKVVLKKLSLKVLNEEIYSTKLSGPQAESAGRQRTDFTKSLIPS
jgi:hypothetical protein